MERFIYTFCLSFTIWLVSSVVNGALIAAWSIFYRGEFREAFPATGLFALCSLLFSIPAIIVFWIFFIVNYYSEALFRVLLKTAIIAAFLSALIFSGLNEGSFSKDMWLFILFPVISSMVALRIHHSSIGNIINSNKKNGHV